MCSLTTGGIMFKLCLLVILFVCSIHTQSLADELVSANARIDETLDNERSVDEAQKQKCSDERF